MHERLQAVGVGAGTECPRLPGSSYHIPATRVCLPWDSLWRPECLRGSLGSVCPQISLPGGCLLGVVHRDQGPLQRAGTPWSKLLSPEAAGLPWEMLRPKGLRAGRVSPGGWQGRDSHQVSHQTAWSHVFACVVWHMCPGACSWHLHGKACVNLGAPKGQSRYEQEAHVGVAVSASPASPSACCH